MSDEIVPDNIPYGSYNLQGTGPDQPIVKGPDGGIQSDTPYRFDLLQPLAIAAIAELNNRGAKYGEWNWTRISTGENLNHGLMHLFAFIAGDTQEKDGDPLEHLLHGAWRILTALDVELRKRQDNERVESPLPTESLQATLTEYVKSRLNSVGDPPQIGDAIRHAMVDTQVANDFRPMTYQEALRVVKGVAESQVKPNA